MGKNMRKQYGFTLIELLVTIAVLAIIAAFAVPAFGDMVRKQNLERSSRELALTFERARSKSALERRLVTVDFSQINSDAEVKDTSSQLYWKPSGKVVKKSTTNQVDFKPDGLVYENGHVLQKNLEITLCDQSSDARYSKVVTMDRIGNVQQSILKAGCN